MRFPQLYRDPWPAEIVGHELASMGAITIRFGGAGVISCERQVVTTTVDISRNKNQRCVHVSDQAAFHVGAAEGCVLVVCARATVFMYPGCTLSLLYVGMYMCV